MMLPFGRPWGPVHAPGPDADAGTHRESGGTFASPSFPVVLLLLAGFLVVFLLHAAARRLWACCFPSTSRPPRRQRPAPARRVDPAEVAASLPVRAHDGGADDDVCAVCLGELRAAERVKAIPACGHVFHPPCIDRWLQSLASCPLCRRSATAPVADGPLKPPQQQRDQEAPAA